jgi:hypothetical protein
LALALMAAVLASGAIAQAATRHRVKQTAKLVGIFASNATQLSKESWDCSRSCSRSSTILSDIGSGFEAGLEPSVEARGEATIEAHGESTAEATVEAGVIPRVVTLRRGGGLRWRAS